MSETFGDRLRAARKRARLRQEDLAVAVGVAGTAITAWENGGRAPGSAEVLIELSRALDVSIDYLLLGRRPAGIDRLVGGIAPKGWQVDGRGRGRVEA